jgi:hypothetical protein
VRTQIKKRDYSIKIKIEDYSIKIKIEDYSIFNGGDLFSK